MILLKRIKKLFQNIQLYMIVSLMIVLGMIVRNTLEFKSIEEDARSESYSQATNIFNYMEAFQSTYNTLIDAENLTFDNLMLLPAHSVNSIYDVYSDLSKGDYLIRSVSDVARNPHNSTFSFEQKALKLFRYKRDNEYFDEVMHKGKIFYFYAKPITIEPMCLKCHGKVEDAPEFIRQSYSTGFGYHEGDIRGITSLLISKESLTKNVKQKYWERVYASLAIVLMIVVLLYVVVRRLTQSEKRLIKELNHLSYSDQLTQIHNRRSLDQYLKEFFEIYKRYQTPYSVIMLDIDYFKVVNDTYGHLVGDKVLVELSVIISKSMRTTDIVGRWGGEEFLVVSPHLEQDEALELARKLRLEVESSSFEEVGHITISCGVTTITRDDTIETLLKRADDALYQAKESGRNCEVVK
jgi:diguanylate cyclase (GGDEF)-like protein